MSKYEGTSWAGYLVDHHWPREPYIPLNKLSIDQYEDCFRKAGIDHAVVYCKDHWGSCYYPTQLGVQHPSVRFDLVGETGEVLRRIGAEFTAYYSVGFDEHAARNHPEWVARDPQGNMLRHPKVAPRPRWHRLCLETGYMNFMLEHLAEIFNRYDPDSVFLDILGHPHGTFWGNYLCYCEHCQRAFKDLYRYEIPQNPDQMREHAFDVEDYKAKLDFKWIKTIRKVIKGIRPLAAISVNSSAHFRWPTRKLIDHHFTEPFWGHWASAVFSRGVGRGKAPQGGAQVVSEIYDPSPPALYRAFAAKHWAQGVRPLLYSPSQRPDGRLDNEEFDRLSEGYRDAGVLRKFIENRSSLTCVGVVYHEQTCVDLPDFPYGESQTRAVKVIEFDKGKPDTSHRRMVGAAIELASYAQVPVDVLTEQDLERSRLDDYQLLLIAGASRLGEREADEISKFVEQGGSVILSGDTGLRLKDGKLRDDFLLADAMGIHFDRIENRFAINPSGSYLSREAHPAWQGLAATDLPLPPPLYVVQPDRAEVLGTHINPCAVHEDEYWTSWWSPAPGEKTKIPLVTHHAFGQGHVVYFAANPFTNAMVWPREGLANLIDWLLDPPPIRARSKSPGALGSTYWRRDESGEIVVHLVNLAIERLAGEVLPIKDVTIEIAKDFGQIRNARLVYPIEQELKVTERQSVQSIRVPAVEVHSVLAIELQR